MTPRSEVGSTSTAARTPAVLLIRTSRAPVRFAGPHQCKVTKGWWVDPWSGQVNIHAADVSIDFTVPLLNAWYSGAWSWTQAQRVAFANDLVDQDHLVPIPAWENEAKGDSGPDTWKPPTRVTSWCR